MLLDTQLERDMGLGQAYTFAPMKKGECFINEDLAGSLNVKKDEAIYH